jgi:hypothetical protein
MTQRAATVSGERRKPLQSGRLLSRFQTARLVPLLQPLTSVMKGCTFADGFGRRFRTDEKGETLEALVLCDELSAAALTGTLLVERAARLEAFSHPGFAAVRRIERRARSAGKEVVIVSEAVPGIRLAELLQAPGGPGSDPRAWLPLFQGIVSAVAALHGLGRDVSHGAIGPERIVVRHDGRPVLVEPVLGAVIEPLGMARQRLWSDYRVPVAPTAGTARLDQRCDVIQLGILALSLGAGRLLGRNDFPNRLPQLLSEVCPRERPETPLRAGQALRGWIARALQFDARSAFPSAVDADISLSALLAEAEVEQSPAAESAAPAGGASEPPVIPRAPFTNPAPQPTPREETRAFAPAVVCPRGASRGRPFVRHALRVSSVAVGLMTLWSATYLGARSYLGLNMRVPPGILVVDSLPAGLEVLVDGSRRGVTPTTIQLRPGAYTLALRSGGGTTLVPVTVSPGQRRLERIELQRGGRTPKRISEELGRPTGK